MKIPKFINTDLSVVQMDLEKEIRKFALQNAVKFDGKANPGAIIGKILGEDPTLKDRSSEIAKLSAKIVAEINKLGVEKQKAELLATAPELLEKKKHEKKDLPELPNAVEGKVVTRIPPEPSKYNHIGHALSFLINYTYAKRYHGKAILRFEDTNPAKASQEYVDAMKEDCLEYLDIHPDKTVYVSDDMQKFYELAEKLIHQGKAYVCSCDRDSMQDLRHKGLPCKHRTQSKEKNLEEWKKMLDGKYQEGEVTLRLAVDMGADNQVMRDPVIMRICQEKHYRQGTKYKVWPMYDFENAVEEHFCGVTHILRSNEFGTMRAELQDYIKDLFGFEKQTIVQYGRFNVVGAITQGREIRELIEKKKVLGWDDPRLVTLKALKRRGILKEAFYELVKEVGLSASQTNLDFTRISAINRRLLDPTANRYFFVQDPIEIKIAGAPKQKIEMELHPDHPERGKRVLDTDEDFFISAADEKELKPKNLYRLMDCLNFTKSGKKFIFDSTDYPKFKESGKKIMHWLPKDGCVEVDVLMPDENLTLIKGLGEKSMENIKVGDVVQLERFGFCRLDSKEGKKLHFWFTHK